MSEVKKVGVWSMAKIQGIMMAIFGLIAGIFISITGGSALTSSGEATLAAIFGVGAIILLPILYGLFGLAFGAVGALIYNLIAKWVGGIEVELK